MGNVTIPLITNEQNREKQTPEEALFVLSFFDIIAPKNYPHRHSVIDVG